MKLRKTCANGIEIIANTNTHLHSFCATVQIRAGAAHEKKAENGITHLMEHCIVRGLKGRFEEDHYVLQSRSGVHLDARTNLISTEYEVSGHPKGIPLAAELISRMFLPIELSAGEFRLEKDRVLAEMSNYTDGGFNAFIRQKVWEGSPYDRLVVGSPAKVKRFSRNRINAYLQSILVPGNVRLCLTGCISEEETDLLIRAAESIPMYEGQADPRELPLPRNFGKREWILNSKADVDFLQFVFDVDEKQCSRAVADLVREIMFAGDDAILYRQISEKTGLIYTYSWPHLEYRGFGITEFGFRYDFARIGPTLEAVMRTMKQLRDGEFDLESKKFTLRTWWEKGLDDPALLNKRMLHNLEVSDSPEPPDWERVTKEDVVAGAEAMFASGIIAIWHRAEWDEVRQAIQPYFTINNE